MTDMWLTDAGGSSRVIVGVEYVKIVNKMTGDSVMFTREEYKQLLDEAEKDLEAMEE